MPIPRSASMIPPLRRSRSASMTSLAQVDLSTLDPDVVLDYARKVMQLQPQPATPSEKLQMLFALSQKLVKWFLEDRQRIQKQLEQNPSSPVRSNTLGPLHTQKVGLQSPSSQQSKEADRPSVASRILASAVAPVVASDVKLAVTLDALTQSKDREQNSPIRPAELTCLSQKSEVSTTLQPVLENADLVISTPVPKTLTEDKCTPVPQVATMQPLPRTVPKTDALEVYLQVQRSVVCMQKYVRGFMARRKFFQTLEELLQGRTT